MWKKVLKIVGFILGSILLGTIGTGLWERIGSTVFDRVSEMTTNCLGAFISNYKDLIYMEIAKGLHEYPAVQIYTMILLFVPGVYVGVFLGLRRAVFKKDKESNSRRILLSKKGYYIVLFITLSALYTAGMGTFKILYINNVATKMSMSITMVAPYVTDQELKVLKSEYCSIGSAEEFKKYYLKIEDIARKNSLRLPKLTII